MALFNVHIGSGGYPPRPPARPSRWHWTLLALLPALLVVAAMGEFGVMAAELAVLAGFLYACWVVGRWLFHSAIHRLGGGAAGMPQGYSQHPPYPPPYAYPPQAQGSPQGYVPPPPPHPPEQPPQGYAWPPRAEGQRPNGDFQRTQAGQ